MTWLALALLTASVAQPNYIPEKYLDCAVRRAAYSYALSLQPSRNNSDVHDALQLSVYCGDPSPPPQPSSVTRNPLPHLSLTAPAFYCDSKFGSDTGEGTQASPFASVQRGVEACRGGGGGCSVVLRDSAPFYLSAPLALDGRDSELTIMAFQGETPVISGGSPLKGAEWVRVPSGLPGANIWRAHVPLPAVPEALLVNGKRQPRARWPNGDVDTDTVPVGWANASTWFPRPPPPPPVVVPGNYSRPEDHFFPNWVWAVNGSALGQFEPPEGFWVAEKPAGGPTYAVPGAFLFNAPHFSPRVSTWTQPTAAVVHAFHGGYWGSWQFRVAGVQVPPPTGSTSATAALQGRVDLGEGGWQEARGWPSGGALYVENVLEELDSPGEWYYDATSGNLTLWYNSTQGTPPPAEGGEGGEGVPIASQLEVLINATGTPTLPILNLTLVGLTFTATQPTFLSHRFRAPSGGDWSFSEVASLTMTHTVGGAIVGCTFSTLGGNGILVSGANQGARVQGCTFSRLGENGVVACGERGILQDLRGKGVPVGTTLVNNVFSELGVFVKQSGAFYSALAANSTVARNIAFNLPRAAVNINDGALGGHLIEGNLFFQTVRETADHGSVNTWERQPYLHGFEPSSSTSNPIPILYGALSRCTANFLICDGYAIHCLDHDDGSNGWEDGENLLAWAGVKNYLGFNKTAKGNLYIRPDYNAQRTPGMHPGTSVDGVPLPAGFYFPACLRTLGQWSWGPTLADSYLNNTCILGGGANSSSPPPTTNPYIFGAGTCQPAAPSASGELPRAVGNTYYTHDAQVAIACGKVNLTLEEASAVGWEVGSKAVSNSAFSNDEQGGAALEALIKSFLGF